MHVYKNGRQYGANGEMGCKGHTFGGATGQRETHAKFVLWAYVGEVESLRAIERVLPGVVLLD